MENLIKELCRTFFQQLPNGLSLIFSIGVVVCLVFILPKRKHHNPLYAAFWLALVTMILWRLIIGLVAVRYVSVLIIPAVIMTAFVGFRAESWWRWLCRRYRFLPRFIGRLAPRLLVYGCSAGALAMAVYNCYAGQGFYLITYEIIKEYKQKDPTVRVVTQRDEKERVSYYTGTVPLPLKDNSKAEIAKFLRNPEANRTLLFIIRDRKKFSRISFEPGELQPGAKWELYRRVERTSGRKSRNKELNVYLYTPSARAEICASPLSPAAVKGNLAENGGFEKTLSQKQALALIPKSSLKEPFCRSSEFLMPDGNFCFTEVRRGKLPSLIRSVNGKKVLSGSASLAVDPRGNSVNFWVNCNLKSGQYAFEFLVRGKPGAVVEVISQSGHGRKKTFKKHFLFKLPDEQLYRCSTAAAFGSVPSMMGIRFRGGEIILDEISLTPFQAK